MWYRRFLRARKAYWAKKLGENYDELYSGDKTPEECKKLKEEREKISKKIFNLKCKISTSEKRYLARL